MEPSYHEAYWLAVATVAPILSLAYIVLLDRGVRLIQPFWQRRPSVDALGFLVLTVALVLGFGLIAPGSSLWRALSSLVDKADATDQPQSDIGLLLSSLAGLFVFTIEILVLGTVVSRREAIPQGEDDIETD